MTAAAVIPVVDRRAPQPQHGRPVPESCEARTDALIFGGGVAGLWLLDELRRAGRSALLVEAQRLGQGQTAASQGIIHGGLKYTLAGVFTPSASTIREMPAIWQECLSGRREPKLDGAILRAEHCHLWRTESFSSRVGMFGAKALLRAQPEPVSDGERPTALRSVRGEVYRIREPVIDPCALLRRLAERNAGRVLANHDETGARFERDAAGAVRSVRIQDSRAGDALLLFPRVVVLAAGAGNARLLELVGGRSAEMQVRPLHMAMVRGELPELNGHCTDMARTRVTITSAQQADGRRVWQLGGQVAEDGVTMSADELLRHARDELAAVVPGLELRGLEWAAYRVDRAEARTAGGRRPDDVSCGAFGNVVYGWPTKLALAPRFAERVMEMIGRMPGADTGAPPDAGVIPSDWRRPEVAPPPWESDVSWRRVD